MFEINLNRLLHRCISEFIENKSIFKINIINRFFIRLRSLVRGRLGSLTLVSVSSHQDGSDGWVGSYVWKHRVDLRYVFFNVSTFLHVSRQTIYSPPCSKID